MGGWPERASIPYLFQPYQPCCGPQSLNPSAQDPSADLISAVHSGDFKRALFVLQNDTRPPWHLNHDGETPLHALAKSSLSLVQIQILSGKMLEKGYDPATLNGQRLDYISLLLMRQDIPAEDLYELIKKAFEHQPTVLSPSRFRYYLNITAQHQCYDFKAKLDLFNSISSLVSPHELCALCNFYIESIMSTPSPGLSTGLQILLAVLAGKNLLAFFNFNNYRDLTEKNLIHLVICEERSPVQARCSAIHSLVAAGVDVNHIDRQGNFPLLLALKSNGFVWDKAHLAECLLRLGAKQRTTLPNSGEPLFRQLFGPCLTGMSFLQISALTLLLTGKDYYTEYFHLTLLGNLFGQAIRWEMDGFSAEIQGLNINDAQISSWMEEEAAHFYSILLNKDLPMNKQFWEEIQAILKGDKSDLGLKDSIDALSPALAETQSVLSIAFSLRKLRMDFLLGLVQMFPMIGFIAMVPAVGNSYHAMGVLFRNNASYLCNKGYGSVQPGVSEHVMDYPERKYEILVDAMGGLPTSPFIRKYFPERTSSSTKSGNIILKQKAQQANNCPIASFCSLELATLYTALMQIFPAYPIRNERIARAIAAVHRKHRKDAALRNYLFIHSEKREVAFHGNFLVDLYKKCIGNDKKKGYADSIKSWAMKHWPDLTLRLG